MGCCRTPTPAALERLKKNEGRKNSNSKKRKKKEKKRSTSSPSTGERPLATGPPPQAPPGASSAAKGRKRRRRRRGRAGARHPPPGPQEGPTAQPPRAPAPGEGRVTPPSILGTGRTGRPPAHPSYLAPGSGLCAPHPAPPRARERREPDNGGGGREDAPAASRVRGEGQRGRPVTDRHRVPPAGSRQPPPPPRQRPPPPGAPFVRGAGGVSGDGRAVRPGLAGRARVCSARRRRGVGDAAPGTRPPAAPPRPRPAAPLTSPLPASVPQAARNRRRLMPMVAETWSAASKPGPAAAAGPPGPGAAPPPPLPAAPPEHGPPRSPSPAVAGAAAGSAGRRLCTAGTRRRDPPGPRRPQPPLPGRAGKRHRPLCAIFTERRRARERGRAAPRALHSASPARGGAA